jgi:hypothetical protein
MHSESTPAKESVTVEPLKPRYVRVDGAVRYSSIGRTSLYEAIKSGAITSFKLGEPGQKKAVRLIDLNSLDKFIQNGGK